MSTKPINEDDKTTVVLDLNELKKQKINQEEDLAKITTDLEFVATVDEEDKNLKGKVILFDFESDFFQKNINIFPPEYSYLFISNLSELNRELKSEGFQIILFNYDINPKVINQLCAQIKKKFPNTKTVIGAKTISAEKAKLHSQSAAGANGYYRFPLEEEKIRSVFAKIYSKQQQAS